MSKLDFDEDIIFSSSPEKNKIKLKILYHNKEMKKIEKIKIGDWIDLRTAEDIELSQFAFSLISLGISVEIPEGYEMLIAPRGSTYLKFGVLQTNSVGVVDNSYKANTDIIKFPALAMRDTFIPAGSRICQFRLVRNQEPIEFIEVDTLDNEERGGFGSTGHE